MKRTFVVIFLTLFLISCNKNDDQISYTKYYVDSEMKDFIFQPTSYWIYKSDSLPGLDSTYIARINHGFLDIYKGLNHGESFEYYSLVSNTIFPDLSLNKLPNSIDIGLKDISLLTDQVPAAF